MMSRVGELTTVVSVAGKDLGVKTWPGVEFTSTIVRPTDLRPLNDGARDLLTVPTKNFIRRKNVRTEMCQETLL